MAGGYNIIQWNCNGLQTRREDMQLLLDQYSPVALCIQETNVKENNPQSFKRYHPYYKESGLESGRGGVGIHVRENIVHVPIPLQTNIQAVAVRITINNHKYSLCSIYVPPINELNISEDELKDLKDQLPSPYLLLGDFNAHSLSWGAVEDNERGEVVNEFLSKHNLVLFNNKIHTYCSYAYGTTSLVDLTMCSPSIYLDFDYKVFDNRHGSDHYPIQLTYNGADTTENDRLPQWNFKKADWPRFRDECRKNIQESIFKDKSDEMVLFEGDKMKLFTDYLVKAATESIPMTSPNSKIKTKPWFDDECKKMIKERNKADYKCDKHFTLENKRRSQIMRAKCRRTIKQKKRSSWRQYVSSINNRTPMKKVWNKIRKITGKNCSKLLRPVQDENGEILTNKEDIANALGRQFEKSSSSENYSPEFQRIKNEDKKIPLNFKTKEDFKYNKKFTMRDLKWSIKKSNNSTPGHDQVHYEIIRHIPEETLKILLNIINGHWTDGTFPKEWRLAFIIPIPKPGKDLLLPINYRPIALTCCICKVVERMVNERLMWYLESEGKISKYQCGYRAKRGTIDHLVRLETFIRDAFRRKEHTVAVFFDLQKAYDTTWKRGILRDLHEAGLRGNLPIFIEQFLDKRTFQVLFSTTWSGVFKQEEGVPQGAILSTTLFNVKINEIAKDLEDGIECSLYVDDFLICFRSKDIGTIERRLQCQIDKLKEWTTKNGFTISKDKTVAMHFSPPYLQPTEQQRDPILHLGDHDIKVVQETKFLGLIWDSKLNFEAHIKYLKQKCTKAMNVLKVLAHTDWGADQSTLLQLYRALIRSKLDYGSIVYGSACQSHLKKTRSYSKPGPETLFGSF